MFQGDVYEVYVCRQHEYLSDSMFILGMHESPCMYMYIYAYACMYVGMHV